MERHRKFMGRQGFKLGKTGGHFALLRFPAPSCFGRMESCVIQISATLRLLFAHFYLFIYLFIYFILFFIFLVS